MLAYTRMLYLPNAIEKMGSAMETAIKKQIEPKKPVKSTIETPSPPPPVTPIAGERITKKHIEALAASIRSLKRDQKPLEANKVNFCHSINRVLSKVLTRTRFLVLKLIAVIRSNS